MARGFIQGYVEQGGNPVITDGRTSTTDVQKSFPLATVTVFNAGTAVLASIFSDSGGTPKANPFIADADASWDFWANPGNYDIQFSGAGITSPFTMFSVFIQDPSPTVLQDPGSNGYVVRTALNTTVARTLTGTANEITITNGNGTGGNSVFSLPAALVFTGKTIAGGAYTPATIVGGTHTSITALSIRSTGAAFDTAIAVSEVLTANRILTVTLNDASRTISLGGNLTTANAFVTSGNFSLTLTQTGVTNVTLPTTGTLATLAGVETFTNKTINPLKITDSVSSAPRIYAITNSELVRLIDNALGAATNAVAIHNNVSGQPVFVLAAGADATVGMVLGSKSTGNTVLQTNGTDRITVNGSAAEVYFGEGITDTTPVATYTLLGTGGSGSNITGTELVLSGGKGTGNAAQALVQFKFPLTGASGTTLQSLSTASFPPWVSMHVRENGSISVTNTVTETSILGASQHNSTKTIEAGLGRAGRIFRLKLIGNFTNSGTPTLRFRLYLGGTVIADTGAIATTNNTTTGIGAFVIDAELAIRTVGAAGTVHVMSLRAMYVSIQSAAGVMNMIAAASPGGGTTVIDFTVAQTFDVTAQWGTAAAANSLVIWDSYIDMAR